MIKLTKPQLELLRELANCKGWVHVGRHWRAAMWLGIRGLAKLNFSRTKAQATSKGRYILLHDYPDDPGMRPGSIWQWSHCDGVTELRLLRVTPKTLKFEETTERWTITFLEKAKALATGKLKFLRTGETS